MKSLSSGESGRLLRVHKTLCALSVANLSRISSLALANCRGPSADASAGQPIGRDRPPIGWLEQSGPIRQLGTKSGVELTDPEPAKADGKHLLQCGRLCSGWQLAPNGASQKRAHHSLSSLPAKNKLHAFADRRGCTVARQSRHVAVPPFSGRQLARGDHRNERQGGPVCVAATAARHRLSSLLVVVVHAKWSHQSEKTRDSQDESCKICAQRVHCRQ